MGSSYLAAIVSTRTVSLSRLSLVRTFAQSKCLRVLFFTAIPHTALLLRFVAARIPHPQVLRIRRAAIFVLAPAHKGSRRLDRFGSESDFNRFPLQVKL